MENVRKDAQLGLEAFQILHNGQVSGTSIDPNISFKQTNIDWGTLHPDYKKESSRAKWTTEEKNYVGQWVLKRKRENPHDRRVISGCLKAIIADHKAHAIFHERHVKDSGRLRTGYDLFAEENNLDSNSD